MLVIRRQYVGRHWCERDCGYVLALALALELALELALALALEIAARFASKTCFARNAAKHCWMLPRCAIPEAVARDLLVAADALSLSLCAVVTLCMNLNLRLIGPCGPPTSPFDSSVAKARAAHAGIASGNNDDDDAEASDGDNDDASGEAEASDDDSNNDDGDDDNDDADDDADDKSGGDDDDDDADDRIGTVKSVIALLPVACRASWRCT